MAGWKLAEGYLSDSLASQPDDSLRMAMVARVLTHIARLTKVNKTRVSCVDFKEREKAGVDSPVIKRALSLSERASTMTTPATAVGVALAHAGVLETCGRLEECENVYMKTVLEHNDSLPCLSAYTRFLKQYGSAQLAESFENVVPALRLPNNAAKVSAPTSPRPSEKQGQLLAMRDKRELTLISPSLTRAGSSSAVAVPAAAPSGTEAGKNKRDALKAVSGSRHQGLKEFQKK